MTCYEVLELLCLTWYKKSAEKFSDVKPVLKQSYLTWYKKELAKLKNVLF